MSIIFLKILGVPILGAGILASVYYGSSYSNNKFVEGINGEYIYNSTLFNHLKLAKDETTLKAFKEKINKQPRELSNTRSTYRIDSSIGSQAIKTIEDYSVKLVTRCGAGTGWFLDYEIPENNKYPTKWFIATNAHVVNQWYFKNNPFRQNLPTNGWNQRACLAHGEKQTNLFLFKEINDTSLRSLPIEKYPEVWSSSYLKSVLQGRSVYALDANKVYGSSHLDSKIVFSHIRQPKLFYAPINFLGDKYRKYQGWWVKDNYYKDFAVIEINFPTEDAAKIITDNFHEKFKNKNPGLNMFHEELGKSKNGEELATSEENYFVAGYPANSYSPYQSFGNYSPIKSEASRLTYSHLHSRDDSEWISVKNQHNDYIIGHVDAGKIDSFTENTRIRWGGRDHKSWGYNYLLDKVNLGPGASGSLVTDSKGNVLGLYRMHDSSRSHGFVEPIRSEGVFKDGKLVYPKYDLIMGSIGQQGSYKEQLDTYYPNIKTMLRNANWSKKVN